jgi:hypothetical protein
MNTLLLKHLRISFLILPLTWALQPAAQADPVPVRAVAGAIHGFLELRSEDGQVVASGDSVQVVRVTALHRGQPSISRMARLMMRRRSPRNGAPFN